MSRQKKKSVVVVKEDNRPPELREKYVERIRNAMTLTNDEVTGLGDDDYITALEEIADDIAMMIIAKREEIAAESD